MELHTADLLDRNESQVRAGKLRVVAPMFRAFGRRRVFWGRIATLKVFEDNSLVRQALESPGGGRVLVVDGGASQRCALLGDQLAKLAVSNGWVGVVIHGCIRDSKAIDEMDLGVLAIGTHPLKSVKKGAGDAELAISFGGVSFFPGEFLYADEDGVIVSDTELPL